MLLSKSEEETYHWRLEWCAGEDQVLADLRLRARCLGLPVFGGRVLADGHERLDRGQENSGNPEHLLLLSLADGSEVGAKLPPHVGNVTLKAAAPPRPPSGTRRRRQQWMALNFGVFRSYMGDSCCDFLVRKGKFCCFCRYHLAPSIVSSCCLLMIESVCPERW